MRTKNSLYNTSASLITGLLTIIIGFFAQRIFVKTLGIEYLGINGIFTNIVMMLGLAELGLGSAIHFHLYKPLADNDYPKIKSLINFYRSRYRVIACVVFLIGILFIPFIHLIVRDTTISENLYFIYLLFLIDAVISYLLTYKRSILYADQRNYFVSLVHFTCFAVMNLAQVFLLLTTKNYYLFLVLRISSRLVENIVLNFVANKQYPYLKDKNPDKLDTETSRDIYKKIHGLIYHKIGAYIVLGTDNILISIFLGVTTVGLYSNYLLVISAINTLVSQMYSSLVSSVGNLLTTKNKLKSIEVYKRLRFGNFWLACFASVSFLVVMNSFITTWIGVQYILPTTVLFALTINLYLSILKNSVYIFKEAAGIFYEDRHIPIIESTVNVVMSLILLHYFGLAGVFIGTFFSGLVVYLYSFPKFVYAPLFGQGNKLYYLEFIKYTSITVIVGALTFLPSRLIDINGRVLELFFNILLCFLIPNTLLYIIFRNSSELKFYKNLAIKGFRKITKRA